MSRNSQSVAIELMDLMRRGAANQEHCRAVLAVRLQMIYDYAYAMGCKAGQELATQEAFDRGFSEGSRSAQVNLPVPLPDQIPQLPAADRKADGELQSIQRLAGKKRLLFGFLIYKS